VETVANKGKMINSGLLPNLSENFWTNEVERNATHARDHRQLPPSLIMKEEEEREDRRGRG